MAISDPCLFRTSQGRVIRCACCGRLEITFRGEHLRASPSDFQALAQTVAHARQEIQETDDACSRWRLSTATEAGTVCVTFSRGEIEALHALLDGAAAMLELETLLHDALGTE